MPEKCNIPKEELPGLLAQFVEDLSPEEEEQLPELFSQYLFYTPVNRGRRKRLLCTHCGDMWEEVDRHKHNDVARCPHCYQLVTYKALGRLGHSYHYPSLHEEHNLVVFRPGPGGALLISAGRVVVDYQPGQCADWPGCDLDEPVWPVPTLDFWERRRYWLEPGRLASWKRHAGVYKGPWDYWAFDCTPWQSTPSAGEPNPVDSVMTQQPDGGRYYLLGLDALGLTRLQFSAVEQYFDFEKYHLFRGVVSYLCRYSRRPQMEFLVKLGYKVLIDRMIEYDHLNGDVCNWRARNPAAFFRLTKAEYRAFAASKGSVQLLRSWRSINRSIPLEQFLHLGCAAKMEPNILEEAERTATRLGLDLPRLLRYLRAPYMYQLWLDYVRMGEQLNLDFHREDVLLPKYLLDRHDAAAETMEYQSNLERMKAYRRRLKKLRAKYELELDGLLIRVPRTSQEIISEGRALRHCVGGYAARHMEGKTTILFLRRIEEPDVSYVTIEMTTDGQSIRQIHGYLNDRDQESPRVTHKDFLTVWLDWLQGGSPRDQAGNPIIKTTMTKQKEAVAG